jgi:hypothetical protein
MTRNRKFEQWQIKYFVKSSYVYFIYILIFASIFIAMSLSIMLDVRQSFYGILRNDVITIQGNPEFKPIDDVAFIFSNRNEEVYVVSILIMKLVNEEIYIHISEIPPNFSGYIMLEINVG